MGKPVQEGCCHLFVTKDGCFASLESGNYKSFTDQVDKENISDKHSVFNDELVTSHYAIIPTTTQYDPNGRPQLERDLYDMIAKRFIGSFMASAIYDVREVLLQDQFNNEYHAYEKILRVPGFLAAFKEETEEDTQAIFSIPVLKEGDVLIVKDTQLKEGKTKRPALHTESSILTFMETAGKQLEDNDLRDLMKGKRIGTVATEESFIPKLLQRKYIEADKSGRLKTTRTGALYVDSFPVEELKNPSFTASLEGEIESIATGEMKLDDFKAKTNQFAHAIVAKLATINSSASDTFVKTWNEQIEVCSCICGGAGAKIIDKGNFYGCSAFPECTITVPKVIRSKRIPDTQIKKLIEEKKTDLLKGFKKEQDIEFNAFLIWEEGKVKFSFPQVSDLSLGTCPKCKNGQVIPVTTKDKSLFYSCSEHKNGCSFTLPSKVLKKTIPESQIKKLLKNGHTDFLPGFISKTKGIEFQAAIRLKEDATIELRLPTMEDRSLGKCPLCSARVVVGKSYYLCENYRKTCDFIINPMIAGKQINSKQIAKLLEKNLTDMIKGFKKKNGEGTFDARLSYDTAKKQLKFVFDDKKKK